MSESRKTKMASSGEFSWETIQIETRDTTKPPCGTPKPF